MTQRVMDRLREKKIFSLEFFVRRNESAAQRELWRIYQAECRLKRKKSKVQEITNSSNGKSARVEP